MRSLFYYFGIRRGKRLFSIKEPIIFAWNKFGDWSMGHLDMFSLKEIFKEKGLDLQSMVCEFISAENQMSGFGKTESGVGKFLNHGRLLKPDIMAKGLNIYFLDEEKTVIFKVPYAEYPKNYRKLIWKFIGKLGIISRKEFLKRTGWMADFKMLDEATAGTDISEIDCVNAKLMFSLRDRVLVAVKAKDYSRIKKSVKNQFSKFVPVYIKSPMKNGIRQRKNK